jgi:hypothetical protein
LLGDGEVDGEVEGEEVGDGVAVLLGRVYRYVRPLATIIIIMITAAVMNQGVLLLFCVALFIYFSPKIMTLKY